MDRFTTAKFEYVTCLKPIFVEHAVKSGFATGMIAWLDFGYNHGGNILKTLSILISSGQ